MHVVACRMTAVPARAAAGAPSLRVQEELQEHMRSLQREARHLVGFSRKCVPALVGRGASPAPWPLLPV